jgi:predicted nucleic-acid-binding Zn-ribbon protein
MITKNWETARKLEEKTCQCVNSSTKIVRDINSSGVSMTYKICTLCGKWTDFLFDGTTLHRKYIKHEDLPVDMDISKIPIINNFSGKQQCAVCGSFDRVEQNHIVPECLSRIPGLKIKADWSSYTIPLCHSCHYDDFHRVVTWYLASFFTDEVCAIIKQKYREDKKQPSLEPTYYP